MTGSARFELETRLRGSLRLFVALVLVHLLAVGTLVASGLTPLHKAALLLALAMHLHHCVRRYLLLSDAASLRAVRWRGGRWWLLLGSGAWREAERTGEMVITGFLATATFRLVDGRRKVPLLLLADSADGDALRRLRVRLRYG